MFLAMARKVRYSWHIMRSPHKNRPHTAGWPLLIALAIVGIVSATTVCGGVWLDSWTAHLVPVANLAGVAYISVTLRRYLAIEEKVRHIPLALARDEPIFASFIQYSNALYQISHIPDPVFRATALQQLDTIGKTLDNLGNGTLVFDNTESWRLVYEQMLRSKVVYLYKSVAWIRDPSYWQDEPGQKSLRLNGELVSSQQLTMERIFIIRDSLWPINSQEIIPKLKRLIEDHRRYGIKLQLIRESSLANDQDLIADFGIYGSHAVGYQVNDEQNHSTRFTLHYDFDKVAQAEQRWNRLLTYAKLYEEIFERPP